MDKPTVKLTFMYSDISSTRHLIKSLLALLRSFYVDILYPFHFPMMDTCLFCSQSIQIVKSLSDLNREQIVLFRCLQGLDY